MFNLEANVLLHRAQLPESLVLEADSDPIPSLPNPTWGSRAFQGSVWSTAEIPRTDCQPSTWLGELEQGSEHILAVPLLPNHKVSHVEVLAVDEQGVPSRGQGQLLHAGDVVVQDLEKRE